MPTEPEARLDTSPGPLALARERTRTRHLARRTEQVYLQWLERYVAFHHGRHPRTLSAAEVEQFLTHLAVHRKVSAATQIQARQALLFIYRHVLDIVLPWLDSVTRATHGNKLPVVLSWEEVQALRAQLQGTGLRDPPLSECGADSPAAARHTRGPGHGSAPVRGCAPAKPFCRHAS